MRRHFMSTVNPRQATQRHLWLKKNAMPVSSGETAMLSPHELATLMLLRDASDPIDLNRADLEVLLERQLVTFEKLASGEHRPLVTASGHMILKAAARIRQAGCRTSWPVTNGRETNRALMGTQRWKSGSGDQQGGPTPGYHLTQPQRTQESMDEIVDLMNEYLAIADKASLYARVLMSFITERERLVRQELGRQIDATTRDREYRARLRQFARTAPLERLLALYEQHRPERSGGVIERREA